jgi:hypothetical protein
MEHMPAERQLNSRQRGMFTFMHWSSIRKAHRKGTLKHWLIASTWSPSNWLALGFTWQAVQDYRMNFWRDDTATLGSGVGGGIGFEHELRSGWTPFGRFGFASNTGTSIKQVEELGLAQVKPFGRRGDMFGISSFTLSRVSAPNITRASWRRFTGFA